MKALFITLVAVLMMSSLVLTACSSQDAATTPETTQPAEQPAAEDDIDTSELDDLEQDLLTIEQQGY